jgi:hypothetical protein
MNEGTPLGVKSKLAIGCSAVKGPNRGTLPLPLGDELTHSFGRLGAYVRMIL